MLRLQSGPAGVKRNGYCYLGNSRALALTHRDHRIYLDTTDLSLTPHLATAGLWEWHVEATLEMLLRPGQQVIEVGANYGYHTLAMAQAIGPQGVLHAFEPNPRVLALLRDTLQVNGHMDIVQLHACAAMDRAGTIPFVAHPQFLGSGHIHVSADNGPYTDRFTVDAVRIDDNPGDQLERIDLLRIDAEGSEPLVLHGAAGLMARSPDLRIVMEWHPVMLRNVTNLAEFAAWLQAFGFRFWQIIGPARLTEIPAADLPELPHTELVLSRQPPA